MELSASKIPRIEVVDALRGFAVMAIILVHNLEHFIFPVYPTEQPAWLAVLNDGVFNVIFSLFAGKAYAQSNQNLSYQFTRERCRRSRRIKHRR